jgi:hypothetical protein
MHKTVKKNFPGVYILENTPPPGGGENISDVIWGKKYENVKNKKVENVKEKGREGEEKGRKREEKGRKGEEKGRKGEEKGRKGKEMRKGDEKGSNKCKIWKN